VVIGIIAVLISVLLPALKMAREQALSAQCLANLRQCGQVLYMYANQNRGFFPQMQLQEPQALPFGQKVSGEQGIGLPTTPDPYYPLYHYKATFSAIGQPPETQGGATVGTLDWRFWDTNHSGDNRDEYIVKLGDKNMSRNVLMTDHSRQSKQGAVTNGFQFV